MGNFLCRIFIFPFTHPLKPLTLPRHILNFPLPVSTRSMAVSSCLPTLSTPPTPSPPSSPPSPGPAVVPPARRLFFLHVSLAFALGQIWTCSHLNPHESLYPPHCLQSPLFRGYTKHHQKRPDSLSKTSISSSLLTQPTQTLHP